MAGLVRVRFVKAFGAFPEGHEEDFLPEALARYGDALELVNPPQAGATAGGVEYDGALLAKMESSLRELQTRASEAEEDLEAERRKSAALADRVAELEAIVASYTGAPATATPAVTPAAGEDAAALTPAPSSETPAPPAAGSEATGPGPAAPASEVATSGEKWRAIPTASLQIPAGLKGTLLTAGMKTAGEVSDGLADGRVAAIPGIGDAKVESLRAHVATLAAQG